MKIPIENLIAQMQGVELNIYQRADALIEFNKLVKHTELLETKVKKLGLFDVRLSLPSDEDIQGYIDEQPYYGSCTSEYVEGIEQGAKWMREQLNSNEA